MRKNMIIGVVALLVGAFGVPSNGFASLDSGLVGYWSFDEGSGTVAHDYSGNGNDGTIHGATWKTGLLGSALEFDGVDDYVNCGSEEIFDMEYGVTLVAWMYKEPGGGYQGLGYDGIITTDKVPSRYTGYILALASTAQGRYEIEAGFGDGGVMSQTHRRSKISPPIIDSNAWHFVVGVIRGPTNMSIYVDGADVGGLYGGSGGPAAWSEGPCVLGNKWAQDFNFKGILDEVRIYNRALSHAEIESLYLSCLRSYFVRGDIQADGDHDIFDALYLLNWLGGVNPAPSCKKTTDVQDDGDADIFDAIYLFNWLGGLEPPPPAPCCGFIDDCGPDPTPNDPTNELNCESYPPCGWNP